MVGFAKLPFNFCVGCRLSSLMAFEEVPKGPSARSAGARYEEGRRAMDLLKARAKEHASTMVPALRVLFRLGSSFAASRDSQLFRQLG